MKTKVANFRVMCHNTVCMGGMVFWTLPSWTGLDHFWRWYSWG